MRRTAHAPATGLVQAEVCHGGADGPSSPPRPGHRERATEHTHARSDALRLLRAVNTTQSHGSVGAKVWPFVAARDAGLRPRTERYDEALWYLLWQGALAADDRVLGIAAEMPFGYSSYALTATAVRMLETS